MVLQGETGTCLGRNDSFSTPNANWLTEQQKCYPKNNLQINLQKNRWNEHYRNKFAVWFRIHQISQIGMKCTAGKST
jgi:hypothetical protein